MVVDDTTQFDNDVPHPDLATLSALAALADEKYSSGDNRTTLIEKMKKKGFAIVEAAPTILQIDWDHKELDTVDFENKLKMFDNIGVLPLSNLDALPKWWHLPSQSGNWHIYVQLREPTPIERRITLQTLLGSDPVREAYNLKRVEKGTAIPIIFFEAPDEPEAESKTEVVEPAGPPWIWTTNDKGEPEFRQEYPVLPTQP
jgi:hypothetical protein